MCTDTVRKEATEAAEDNAAAPLYYRPITNSFSEPERQPKIQTVAPDFYFRKTTAMSPAGAYRALSY
jgi:hypothetical protein